MQLSWCDPNPTRNKSYINNYSIEMIIFANDNGLTFLKFMIICAVK